VVADFLRHHYKSLVRHARRHVRHLELAGESPVDLIDPREVVDEIVRRVMNGWREKPVNSDWLVWFYELIRAELRSQGRANNKTSDRSLEELGPLPDEAQPVDGYEPEQPLDIISQELEPFVAELRELVPDPASVPPDVAVAQKEILELLQSRIQSWPRPERDVFELHFVEGFDPGDVAMVAKQPLGEVREIIARLHQRLRGLLLEDAS
jgi:RNA polymerase sigma factor (sigma-70 family)